MKTKKIIIGSIVLAAVAFAVYSLLGNDKAVIIEAETVLAKKANVTTMVTATGTIEPITQVEVGTQVSGVVENVYVDFNSVVSEGQLIAELDKTNLKVATTQAQAAYDNAVTQTTYLKSIYDRQVELFEKELISQSDLDLAVYNYETAKGTEVQRLLDLERAKTNLSYADIYSPIDGVVLSKDIDEGQTVAASFSTPTLFTIAQDLSEMQVEADVDEADIGYVKEGQRVEFTVDAYIGETFEGVVTQVRLDPTVTSNVVTYTVVIKAENQDFKLKPGLTATISIYTLELNDVLTAQAKAVNFKPTPAVLMAYNEQKGQSSEQPKGPPPGEDENNESSMLWVLDENGTITPRTVTLGASDGVNVQVLSGIQEGAGESPFMPKPPGGRK